MLLVQTVCTRAFHFRGVSYHYAAQMQKYVSKGTTWRQYLKSNQVEIW
jgi:hypothetical protein